MASSRGFQNNSCKCKCKRKQSSQNEKRSYASSTNEDTVEMETDYQNLSELRLSQQHYYEQVEVD